MLLTDGALHGITDTVLRTARAQWSPVFAALPEPRVAVVVGGTVSRRWWQRPLAPDLTAAAAAELLRTTAAAAGQRGGSLLVTTSRRTSDAASAAVAREVRAANARGVPARAWAPSTTPPDSNPYIGLLAWADYLVLTPDSISMASEACATRNPVYVAWPHQCHRRFARFHERMLARGHVRAWPTTDGMLEPPMLWRPQWMAPASDGAAPLGAPPAAPAAPHETERNTHEDDLLRTARAVRLLLERNRVRSHVEGRVDLDT